MAGDYVVRPATLDDVPALGAIETRASALFRGLVPEEIAADNAAEATLSAAAMAGRLFVAEAPDGALAGFALVVLLPDASAHLEELDVLPELGRRGIGSALLEASCAWARANGQPGISLSTFRDVPFNAPFYARRGFRALAPAELTPALAQVVELEQKKGLDAAPRVVMRREL
jgi:GNAT superfamily N-acetyltransferase